MNDNYSSDWPALSYTDMSGTISTIHMVLQMAGKIRLANTPWINHSWHVTLYVNATGFTTGSIPYNDGIFQVDLDSIHHQVHIITSTGNNQTFDIAAKTIAGFYVIFMDKLNAAGINCFIHAIPNEVDPAIPFNENHSAFVYDAAAMHNLWQALVRVNNVFTRFRAGFQGKCSPVHLFWGAFDLAVTRFSGRPAPLHPGGAPNMPLAVMQEAYSQEVSSCGFWPGNEQYPHPSFYSYCYPAPADFGRQKVSPAEAFYSTVMGEFLLPYEVVQQSATPEETLLQFLQTTYDAAAAIGNWDKNLQCDLSWLKHNIERQNKPDKTI